VTESKQQGIQRILVAIDNLRQNERTLETAVELAAELQAELHGLYVEDENLLRLASMPFSREIGSSSAFFRPLSRNVIERTFRANAEEARRTLIASALRANVEWAFQVCRGQLLATTLAEAEKADLTIVEPQSSIFDVLPESSHRIGRSLASAPPLSSQWRMQLPAQIAVIIDGTSCAFRALGIALSLGRTPGAKLTVAIAPTSEFAFHDLRSQADRIIQEQPSSTPLDIELISSNELADRKVYAGKDRLRLVFLNRYNLFSEEPRLKLLIQNFRCPLALV
jgi:nucleotide-binding universal stress UspA family protein